MAAAVSPLSYEKELAAVAKLLLLLPLMLMLLLLPLMLMLLLLLRSLKKLVSARIFFSNCIFSHFDNSSDTQRCTKFQSFYLLLHVAILRLKPTFSH